MVKELEISLKEFENKKFAVALSGGRDSVALLHLFLNSGANFFAVNVEHGIRGESSIKDSQFAKQLCKSWGIEFVSFSVDALKFAEENKLTVEQSARILRYQIFDDLVRQGKCDYVALAHHADDQVETLLMRVFRGTGINGLKGMQRINGAYFRPLLEYTRQEIDEYILKHSLPYVEDETNADTAYTRNFLREEIKNIKRRYPNLEQAILRLARNAEETETFINDFIAEPENRGGEIFLGFENLENPALFKRAIMRACNILGVYQDIEERHFDLIWDLKKAQNGAVINLPHNLKCSKESDGLYFYLENDKTHIEKNLATQKLVFSFSIDNLKKIGIEIFELEKMDKVENGVLYADFDKIPKNAVIRRRAEGDFICKFGGGTKSLGDFLTDKKYPKRKREQLWVLASDNEIIVVFGLEISAKVAVDAQTKRIISFKNTNNNQ